MDFFHKKTNFRFMATRKVWYTLSAILMIVSFASFYLRGLNFAVDFTGGISVEATFPKEVDRDSVRKAIVAAGFHDPQVSGSSNRDVTIGLQTTGQSADQLRPIFKQALESVDPGAKITSLDVVGPQVGDELRSSAIVSMAVTLALIALYIILRFHTWRLSLGAIVAVLHDPILVLGVFSVTQTRFDLPVVAAILGIVLAGMEEFKRIGRKTPSPMGLGLGRLLPFSAVSTIFLGSIGGLIWQKRSPRTAADYLVPLASGLIAGEALMAVILAGLVPLLTALHVPLPLFR